MWGVMYADDISLVYDDVDSLRTASSTHSNGDHVGTVDVIQWLLKSITELPLLMSLSDGYTVLKCGPLKALSLSTILHIIQSIVMSVVLYGGETWTSLHLAALSVCQMSWLHIHWHILREFFEGPSTLCNFFAV